MGNRSCPALEAEADPIPFFSDGNLVFKAHHVGWIVSGFFAIIASTASFWLIYHHLTYYTNKRQQRHIVRLLLMVPIYACVSFLSYVFYQDALYFELIRDCYEAFVIASFFYLLLSYLGETEREQKEIFRRKELEKWMWPFGFVKYRPSGLYFLQLQKWGIMQYVFIRPVSTLAAVVCNYLGLYCVDSYSPIYSHIWITVAISISVSIAMYCVLQLYVVVAKELKPFHPIMKFLCIKSVVFLTFWQASMLSVLASFGAIKATKYMTSDDVLVGLNALLETFEMLIFAFLHIRAFTYLTYRPDDRTLTTSRWRSLLHALDFRDFGREFSSGSTYMIHKMRGRSPDGPDREKDFEIVMGKRREREIVASLSAAELARRRVGDEEKWGIGSEGTRDEAEDDVWDTRVEVVGYSEEERRADRRGREEERIANLTDWYDARHPETRRSAWAQSSGGNAAGRGVNGPNRGRSDEVLASPRPSLFPSSRPVHLNYQHPDYDPEVDDSLNRRLATAVALAPVASSSNGHGLTSPGHPTPSPIVLLRADSPAQSEMDRRHYDGRSREQERSDPEVPTAGGGKWWRWIHGGGGGEAARPELESGEIDDGLTTITPPSSSSKIRRGRYVGVDQGDTIPSQAGQVILEPTSNFASRPTSSRLIRPPIPIGPNSLRIYDSPAPIGPIYTHQHIPSPPSRSSLVLSPLVAKPPTRHRESTASYVSAESPLDRLSTGSIPDNPEFTSLFHSVEHSETGTFGQPTRPSSPALLYGMKHKVDSVGSPNSFKTALSTPAPLSPTETSGTQPFFPASAAPPPPPRNVPAPPSSSAYASRPQTCSSAEANQFYISESRAVPRKIVLPTPLSPARYPSIATQHTPQPPQPDRSILRTTQPHSSSSSRGPNALPSAPSHLTNPSPLLRTFIQTSYDPRFPHETRGGR